MVYIIYYNTIFIIDINFILLVFKIKYIISNFLLAKPIFYSKFIFKNSLYILLDIYYNYSKLNIIY